MPSNVVLGIPHAYGVLWGMFAVRLDAESSPVQHRHFGLAFRRFYVCCKQVGAVSCVRPWQML